MDSATKPERDKGKTGGQASSELWPIVHRRTNTLYTVRDQMSEDVPGTLRRLAEIESALVLHDKVAEAAVVGYPHDITGQGIYAYVTLVKGVEATEDLRKELCKVASRYAEGGKVALRNIRRDANSDFKDLLKEKEITEDEERRGHDEVQKLTDSFVARVDKMLSEKEADLMEI